MPWVSCRIAWYRNHPAAACLPERDIESTFVESGNNRTTAEYGQHIEPARLENETGFSGRIRFPHFPGADHS